VCGFSGTKKSALDCGTGVVWEEEEMNQHFHRGEKPCRVRYCVLKKAVSEVKGRSILDGRPKGRAFLRQLSTTVGHCCGPAGGRS